MTKQPLVSVSIPTYNSGDFLQLCLDAIKAQTYNKIETHIIDGESKDDTLDIAKKNKIASYTYKDALLGAREYGLRKSKGTYVLLLDSDQVLETNTIERAVAKMQEKDLDMLVLEEDVYRNKNFIERLFHYDRRVINAVRDLNPNTGVMLPRMYKTSFLKKVFANMDEDSLKSIGGQDHAIIYYEAWQLSQKVDIVDDAVKHIEPSKLRIIIPKFYRWGRTSVGARKNKYSDMLSSKERFRPIIFKKGLFIASLGSMLLLLIKGVPYKIGVLKGRIG